MTMKINFRAAIAHDIHRCIELRGLTNDNPFTRSELGAIGVTAETWGPLIGNAEINGSVALDNETIIGFCFGEVSTGEILVLAVLAEYEGIGLGKALLNRASEELFSLGHRKLFLAASATPIVRSYGFYRRVGWEPTNTYNDGGDEILTLQNPVFTC
jgi:GNAT superfamily N-acetyltransferase